MSLDKHQFLILRAQLDGSKRTQRGLAAECGISVGSVNKAVKSCTQKAWLTKEGTITDKGKQAMEPYAVRSAIILAAGAATRMAPLSFEKPKGLFKVQGEVLIERLIRQMQEAGIEDITVVVGCMKESFFYLADIYGVRILNSSDYAERNNHSSLLQAKKYISSSYICASDQYIPNNPFHKYMYASTMPVYQSKPQSTVRAVTWDAKGKITGVERTAGWYPRGPVYLTSNDSEKLLSFIQDEFDFLETRSKLWDTILLEHAQELEVNVKQYMPGEIYEFDQLQDLIAFDSDFLVNVDSAILDNICNTLNAQRQEITGVEPLKAGLTNLSVLFSCKGKRYVYRHPGNGTDEIINRHAEAFALNVAKRLGLDETYLYENPDEGWKISAYVDGCTDFDYRNSEHVKKALRLAKRLHESGVEGPWTFDFFQEGLNIIELLKGLSYPLPPDFDELLTAVTSLNVAMQQDIGEPCLCHNDFYAPNFLVKGDDMWLIDWEYAAMGDWACDIGNFVAQGSGYSVEEATAALEHYFGRPATVQETRHCIGAVGVVGFYWYVWAMYKEAMGNPVGEWLYTWYKAAKCFTAAARKLYEQ